MRRIVTASFSAALLVVAAAAGLLAYPEPLYAYHVEEGRLRLYSDKPFDEAIGRAVLAEVERRLALAPPELQDAVSVHRIFVSNDEWRRRLVFLWNDGAGGVNYYPIAGSVFLRQADINTDRLLRGNGQPVPPPRTLTYYAGHEIGHSLIGRRVAAYGNWRLPAWVREGLADYLAFGGDVDVDGLAKAWRAGARALDPQKSGDYALYRLLVAYFLQKQGWSVERLLATEMSRTDAEAMLEAGMPAN